MREILFRGKRVDNGEWVEGDLLRSRGKCYIHEHIDPFDYLGELSGFIKMYEVIPETVGQYTGLTDKNGKKIFEGDIVRNNKYGEDNDTYDYYSTIFSNGSFRAQYLDNLKYTPKIYDIYFEGYEVIGNIHDNPELLQEDKE